MGMQKQLHETRKLMSQGASFESSCGTKMEKHLRLLLSAMQQHVVVDNPVAAAHVRQSPHHRVARSGDISPMKKSKTQKLVECGDVLQLRADELKRRETIGPPPDRLGQDVLVNSTYHRSKEQPPGDDTISTLGPSTLNAALDTDDKRLAAAPIHTNPPHIEPHA